MKVAVFPSDDGGCGFFRLRYAAEALAAQGHPVTVDPRLGYYRDPTGAETTRLFLDADVAVVQRIVSLEGLAFVTDLKDHGHRVVVDVDDDLDALHPDHPYLTALEPEGRGADVLHEVCRLADVVTCTTQPLADRYGYGKAVVLPNLIPARWLEHRRVRSRRVAEPLLVGWTGRPQSHVNDALVMGKRVGPVVAAAGGRFAAWGQTADITWQQVGAPVGARRRMPFRPLTGGYPQQVAKLDVGLAPLQDSTFCRAKSWLKCLELSALGVPWVASPLPEYAKLHALGAGLLAASPAEWAEHVGRLLASPRERSELAEAGREVARGLTVEAHAGRWLDAWTGSCDTLMPDELGSSVMAGMP